MSWALLASFRAYGTPKGQPRVRRSKSGGMYTPENAAAWKSEIQLAANLVRGLHCASLTGPVRVDERFFFPCPKHLTKKAAAGLIPHTAKPDRDNCDKVVLDALTGIGAYGDDAQVAAGVIEKWYESPGYRPGAEVHIFVWKEE